MILAHRKEDAKRIRIFFEPLKHLVGRKGNLIARSRERFAMQRMTVENKLTRWLVNQNDSFVIK
jgi:hypothetical protein